MNAMNIFPLRRAMSLFHRCNVRALLSTILGAAILNLTLNCAAQSKPAAPDPAPDVLVLSNGDTLHGKFVSEMGGKVTFHSDPLGDVAIAWDKIKEMHVAEPFAVLNKNVKVRGKKSAGQIPAGTFDVTDKAVTVHPEKAAAPAPIPVADAEYIIDEPTLNKQVFGQPSFFSGWNGPATAGATLVTATENQYTFSGAVNLVRALPTVNWLAPRDRTLVGFSASFGKITEPGYTIPASGSTPASTVAPVTTQTAIYHAAAERDQYVSPRFFALAQTAFDHNYSQNLALQQIYGGGMGWTAIKTAKQALDVKATIQYEVQQFLGTPATAANPTPPPPSPTMNLVGSTVSANYGLHLKLVTLTQSLSFIPSFNDARAYSANETNTFAFPAYKNLSFSVGTLDSYLNDTPVSEPPTKPNSFQFTMGLTYAIKSKY